MFYMHWGDCRPRNLDIEFWFLRSDHDYSPADISEVVPEVYDDTWATATPARFVAGAKKGLLPLMYGSLRAYTKYATYNMKNVIKHPA